MSVWSMQVTQVIHLAVELELMSIVHIDLKQSIAFFFYYYLYTTVHICHIVVSDLQIKYHIRKQNPSNTVLKIMVMYP